MSDLQKAGACRCGSCVARCQISSFTEGAKAIAASSGKAAGFHISLTSRTMRAPPYASSTCGREHVPKSRLEERNSDTVASIFVSPDLTQSI